MSSSDGAELRINEGIFTPNRGHDRAKYRSSDLEATPAILKAIKDSRMWLVRINEGMYICTFPDVTDKDPAQDGFGCGI